MKKTDQGAAILGMAGYIKWAYANGEGEITGEILATLVHDIMGLAKEEMALDGDGFSPRSLSYAKYFWLTMPKAETGTTGTRAKAKIETFDLCSQIIAFETGELDDDKTIDLFAMLIKTGQAWTLQGSYGRTAASLIEGGYISKEGNVLQYA